MTTCDKAVYWWDGEYEGNCELPEGHKGPHFDGMSWFSDNNEEFTPPTTEDLLKWLNEQIAEDERIAREASDDPVDSELQARWTPEQVLIECAVKRRLIAFALDDDTGLTRANSCVNGEWGDDMELPATQFRILAMSYTQRPGYWEQWRVQP